MPTESSIAYFVSYVTLNIPDEILKMCISLCNVDTVDQFIQDIIIAKYVFKDIQTRAGKPILVEIDPTWRVRDATKWVRGVEGVFDYYGTGLYRIPPEARENRPIVSVSYVHSVLGEGYYGLNGTCGNGLYTPSINSFSNYMIESRTYQRNPPKPDVELLGIDIIKVKPDTFIDNFALHCKIGYDENFTNINNDLLHELRKLVLLRTKTWIYNTFIIKMDSGEVRSGMEIGAFKDRILTYEPNEEDYDNQIASCANANGYDPAILANRIRVMI